MQNIFVGLCLSTEFGVFYRSGEHFCGSVCYEYLSAKMIEKAVLFKANGDNRESAALVRS